MKLRYYWNESGKSDFEMTRADALMHFEGRGNDLQRLEHLVNNLCLIVAELSVKAGMSDEDFIKFTDLRFCKLV